MMAKDLCDFCGEVRRLQRVEEPNGLEWDLCFACVDDVGATGERRSRGRGDKVKLDSWTVAVAAAVDGQVGPKAMAPPALKSRGARIIVIHS